MGPLQYWSPTPLLLWTMQKTNASRIEVFKSWILGFESKYRGSLSEVNVNWELKHEVAMLSAGYLALSADTLLRYFGSTLSCLERGGWFGREAAATCTLDFRRGQESLTTNNLVGEESGYWGSCLYYFPGWHRGSLFSASQTRIMEGNTVSSLDKHRFAAKKAVHTIWAQVRAIWSMKRPCLDPLYCIDHRWDIPYGVLPWK